MGNNQIKVALITGAARRIGAAIAQYLHDKGMNVILHCHHSLDEANQLSHALNQKRANSAVVLQADLEEAASLAPLIQQSYKQWHRLDVIVNNASKFFKTKIGNMTVEAFDELMHANARAPLLLSQAAVPYLKETQGCIVNIADVHGERPMGQYTVYCMSKAAIIMLTQSLAKELGPEIRVNAVSPGEILWPEGENMLGIEEQQKIISRTALLRHGDPVAIAKAVYYLVNDADYVTGQVLAVDGGRLLMM